MFFFLHLSFTEALGNLFKWTRFGGYFLLFFLLFLFRSFSQGVSCCLRDWNGVAIHNGNSNENTLSKRAQWQTHKQLLTPILWLQITIFRLLAIFLPQKNQERINLYYLFSFCYVFDGGKTQHQSLYCINRAQLNVYDFF